MCIWGLWAVHLIEPAATRTYLLVGMFNMAMHVLRCIGSKHCTVPLRASCAVAPSVVYYMYWPFDVRNIDRCPILFSSLTERVWHAFSTDSDTF
jgi:hypothetical protein